jgi:hypothetical protein
MSLLFAIALGVSFLALFSSSVSSSAGGQKRSLRQTTQTVMPEPAKSPESSRPSENSKQQANTEEEIEEGEDDPDLPPGARGLDKEAYLRRREQYVGLRRGIEFGRPFDPGARGRAIEQMQAQETIQAAKAKLSQVQAGAGFFGLAPTVIPVWTALGPAPLPSGPFTGRVTAIVVDPTNSSKVYLGTAQGGVWRSLDGGVNWINIFDNAESQAVGSLALAPSNPTILYVGTGETNRSADSFFGVGLYRIDNADTSATLVGPINPTFSFNNGSGTVNTTTFAGRSISKIIVHPTQPGTIFVSTSSGVGGNGANSFSGSTPPLGLLGVYRSANADGPIASITFQKLAVATGGGSLDVPGTGNRRVTDMVMEPANPNNLVVGVFGNLAPNDGGIFRTTNALDPSPSFTNVLTISTIRIQLAINKDLSSGVVKVLAATSETPTTASCSAAATQQGILRQSVDGGANWPSADATATTGGILVDAGGFCGGQCFYNVTVAIDPKNANSIYLGGNVPNTCSGLMLRSANGVTFSNDANFLHADSHALYFDPLTTPSTVFAGNDGGVWKRSADAAIGTLWTNLNNAPLNTLQFESLAVHPTDRNVTIGGTQDNGTELQQTTSGAWLNSQGGDGGYTLIDQSATDTTNVTMYHTFYFDGSGGSASQIRFERVTTLSAAATRQWTSLGCSAGVPANGISCSASVLFYAPMALGPGSPNTVYLGTDRLYRSTDRGTNNVTVSQQPISGSPISTIAISPQDDNCRILGMQNGEVWATSTGSSTLVNITSAAFPANPNGSITNKFVGRAIIDPNNKDVAYIAFSFFAPAGKGVWKITNLGAAASSTPATPNWTSAGNGIPSIPINGFAVDPTNSNNLFAGTDIGVYNSTDGGATWNPYGVGLPRSAVFDIAIQPTNRILRVATHGRGIWETDVIAAPPPNMVQFSGNSTSVSETLDQTTTLDLTVTRAGDISGAATIDYSSADGTASERSDYEAARGTLHFAGGEASKTITLFIVDDRFGEGPETFTVDLSNPVGCTLGSQTTFTITINSNEAVNGLNPVKDASFNNDFFVRQHYLDFFNREPDSGGLAFWKNQLNECENVPLPGGFTNAQQCREIRRINVSAAFFLAIEFQQTGYLVERLYKTAYGSATGTSTLGGVHQLFVPIVRLNEFLPDTQQIGKGVVIGQPGADQILETNKQTLIAEFVQRSRFLTAYPTSMTSAQFVDTLNTNAGGPLSQSERDQLVTDLTAGTKTRAQVLRAVAEDSDLFNAEQNRAFVLAQFFGYLRRNPNDSPDADYTGYDFWLGKLIQFNGNFVDAEMVKSFLVSGEYQQRFGP